VGIGALVGVNTVIAAVFILLTFLLMVSRQIQAVLHAFVWQSLFLALSTFTLALIHHSVGLVLVGCITIAAKTVVIPSVLTRTLGKELRSRREIESAVNVPTSLLLMLGLSVLAYFLLAPFLAGAPPGADVNLPLGLAALLVGVYTLAIRREAVAQMLALMAIDNGAFFAGIAITTPSAVVELAAGLEGVTVVLIVAILTRAIAQQIGSTEVSTLSGLKEGAGEMGGIGS
jgi:hydrogenase-4 component E